MLRVKTASRIIGKPKKFDIVLQCNVSDLTGRLRQRCHQMQTLTRPLKYLEKKNLISNVCAAKRRRFLLYLSFAKRWLSILTTKFYTETHRWFAKYHLKKMRWTKTGNHIYEKKRNANTEIFTLHSNLQSALCKEKNMCIFSMFLK